MANKVCRRTIPTYFNITLKPLSGYFRELDGTIPTYFNITLKLKFVNINISIGTIPTYFNITLKHYHPR